MKHCAKGRKLNRKRDQRKALLRNLAVSLILKEKIKTTEAKAKELRPFAEKLITKGKKPSLAATRDLASVLPVEARKKLTALAARFKGRAGGYTRIIKLNPRRTDGAKMAIIEFV
jgi:large subunit ribosomal protein L17